MPALALITLVFQALLLAHGGLTTLGANLFSLGVVGPWAMWLLLRLLLRIGWKRDRCIFLSTVVGRSGNLRNHRLPVGPRLSFRAWRLCGVLCEVPGRVSDHSDSDLDRGRPADGGAVAEPGGGSGCGAARRRGAACRRALPVGQRRRSDRGIRHHDRGFPVRELHQAAGQRRSGRHAPFRIFGRATIPSPGRCSYPARPSSPCCSRFKPPSASQS